MTERSGLDILLGYCHFDHHILIMANVIKSCPQVDMDGTSSLDADFLTGSRDYDLHIGFQSSCILSFDLTPRSCMHCTVGPPNQKGYL